MIVQPGKEHRRAVVLLVEDSPADAELAVIAIKQNRRDVDVHVVDSGDAALAFLQREGEHRDAPRPDLVLLDLNVPGKDGTQVLEVIKGAPSLFSLPVIVFSNSSAVTAIKAGAGDSLMVDQVIMEFE